MGATSEMHISIQDQIMQQINDAEIGNISHIDTLINLREHRSKLQQSLDLIKSYEQENESDIKNEIQEYPEGYKGYDFELRTGRTMYDYKGIQKIDSVQDALTELKSLYKTAFLQRQKGLLMLDEESGEIIDEFPKVSYGKGSIVLKPKK
jgi:hypothetical protein